MRDMGVCEGHWGGKGHGWGRTIRCHVEFCCWRGNQVWDLLTAIAALEPFVESKSLSILGWMGLTRITGMTAGKKKGRDGEEGSRGKYRQIKTPKVSEPLTFTVRTQKRT